MTREQIIEQFPEATKEQINAILNINGADITREKEKAIDPKELKRLQEIESKYKELEDANLTDAEKIARALEEANNTKSEFAKKTSRLEVEKILVAAGLKEEDYKDLIDTLVSEDLDKSKNSANAFATLVSKQKETAVQKTKEEMMDNTPTPGGNGGSNNDEKSEAEKIAETIGKSMAGSESTKTIVDSYL